MLPLVIIADNQGPPEDTLSPGLWGCSGRRRDRVIVRRRRAQAVHTTATPLVGIQKVVKPAVPAKNRAWVRNEVDAFIMAKLEEKGLSPAPPADRVTLIRRATLDLTGLAPTPEEVQAFVSDTTPEAFTKVVDRLLDSPRYGERWARHWMDLARYADSEGFKSDETRPNIWRYRDYVIDSFNQDKPYDRFMKEQIAGDRVTIPAIRPPWSTPRSTGTFPTKATLAS